MNVNLLLGILNRPWLIEPNAGRQWAAIADKVLYHGAAFAAPGVDKRQFNTDTYYNTDLGAAFRVNADGTVNNKSGSIQVLKVQGPIAKQDYCGTPGSLTLSQMLAAANADPGISAIMLWMDSPGGQVDGTENFANDIRNSTKPVVAFGDAMICSAAYWFASACTEIMVDGSNNGWNATIGSIGTMSAWVDDSEAMAKEGYKLVTVFADDSADKWGDFFAVQKGDFTDLKKMLNGMNETFTSAVKANRAGKLSTKENVLTGKVYNATDAKKYGLIDSIGSFTDAVKRAAQLGKKSSKTSTSMYTFQNTLAAANSETFAVTEGGFLLTEQQLTAIDAKLATQQSTIDMTASEYGKMKAQADAFAKNDESIAALAAATDKITTLEASLATATEKIATLEKAPGGFFKTAGGASEANDPGDEDETEALMNSLPHNQKADALLG